MIECVYVCVCLVRCRETERGKAIGRWSGRASDGNRERDREGGTVEKEGLCERERERERGGERGEGGEGEGEERERERARARERERERATEKEKERKRKKPEHEKGYAASIWS